MRITGVLKIKNRYKFPANKRNIPRYQFIPLDKQKHDHEYLVASNIVKQNPKRQDYYVIIEPQNQTSQITPLKRSYGNLIRIIGPVTDYQSTARALASNRNLYLSKLKYTTLSFDPLDTKHPHRHLPKDYPIYSIDPAGCLDIDDAFSYVESESKAKMGIHIADVTYIMKQINLLTLGPRYSSVYLPSGEIRHMIPEEVATRLASLRPHEPHVAWTLWLDLESESESESKSILKSYHFERTLIYSQGALSYDEIDRTPNPEELLPNANKIYEVVQKLGQQILGYKMPEGEKFGSHQLIEVLMILTNHLFALHMYHQGSSKVIYRIHSNSNLDESTNTLPPKQMDSGLKKFLAILRTESATYMVQDELTTDQAYYHFGLQIHHYAHFTSPIRRYADYYNHLVLAGDPILPELDIQAMNEYQQECKKLSRELDKLKLLKVKKSELQGYLLNDHQIYFPKPIDLSIYYTPIHRKLITITVEEDESQYILTNHETENDQILSIPKYELRTYQIAYNPAGYGLNQKIMIRDPEITEFINTK